MYHWDEYFVLFMCGVCVVIAIGLFARKYNFRNTLLALMLLCLPVIQLGIVFLHTRKLYTFPYLFYTHDIAAFLLPPLFYIYIQTFTGNKRSFSLYDIPHAIPMFIVLFFAVPYMFLPEDAMRLQIDAIYKGNSVNDVMAYGSMISFLTYFSINIYILNKAYMKNNPLHKRLYRVFILFLSWIVLVLLIGAGLLTGYTILWRAVNFIFSIEVLLLYIALQRMPFLMSFATLGQSVPKAKSRVLSSIDTENLCQKIIMLMEEEKLFCDEDLSLSRLAKALEVTTHQLSAFLNEHYEQNFNAFVNNYRIQYAENLLKSDKKISTLSTAFACGFNSYSAFYSAFKKITGKSPGEYKTKQ